MTDGSVCGFGFGLVCSFLRKIRPTQLWVELSWVVANMFIYFEWVGELKFNF